MAMAGRSSVDPRFLISLRMISLILGAHQAPPLRRLAEPSRETMASLLETLPVVAWSIDIVLGKMRNKGRFV